jgi:hypothetical protein
LDSSAVPSGGAAEIAATLKTENYRGLTNSHRGSSGGIWRTRVR